MLVARSGEKLRDLALALISRTGVSVAVLAADLGNRAELVGVEERLRDDAQITGLIDNAGMAGEGPFASADPDYLERIIQLNVTTVTRLRLPDRHGHAVRADTGLPGVLRISQDDRRRTA